MSSGGLVAQAEKKQAVLLVSVPLDGDSQSFWLAWKFIIRTLSDESALILGGAPSVSPESLGIRGSSGRGDLDRNNITRITKMDFAGLRNLRVLHLEDNQVSVIERGAFQDLKQLERLRLNKNKLQVLPEMLFQSTPKLTRLNPPVPERRGEASLVSALQQAPSPASHAVCMKTGVALFRLWTDHGLQWVPCHPWGFCSIVGTFLHKTMCCSQHPVACGRAGQPRQGCVDITKGAQVKSVLSSGYTALC
ncbi:hypothetical protein CB1_001327010 [Camelus ferus]|nr:hypothetical protein CB1_001327010 [Camelus ferus]